MTLEKKTLLNSFSNKARIETRKFGLCKRIREFHDSAHIIRKFKESEQWISICESNAKAGADSVDFEFPEYVRRQHLAELCYHIESLGFMSFIKSRNKIVVDWKER